MKRLLFLLCAAGMAACNNTTTTTTTTTTTVATVDSAPTVIPAVDTMHELLVLDSALKQFETPPQAFKAPINHLVKFTGTKGTIVTVNGEDLETRSGKPLGNHIDVELKELTTTEELARNRVNTVGAGSLLDVHAVYSINMSSGGEELRLKKDKTLEIAFPASQKIAHMFSGNIDTVQRVVVWQERPATDLSAGQDAATPTGGAAETTPDAAKAAGIQRLTALGWLCIADALKDSTAITVKIAGADSLGYVACWLMSRKPCTVVYKRCRPSAPVAITGAPAGSKARFVAVGYKDGKYYGVRQSFVVTAGQSLSVKMAEMSPADISALFTVK